MAGRARCSVLVAAVLLLLAAAGNADHAKRRSYDGVQMWRVEGVGNADIHTVVGGAVSDIWKRAGHFWDLLVAPAKQKQLRKALTAHRLNFSVAIEDVGKAISEESRASLAALARSGTAKASPWTRYWRLAEVNAWLDGLAKRYPKTVSVITIGKSLEGRPMRVLHIKAPRAGARTVYVDAGIHAREWIASASLLFVANELVTNRKAHAAWLDKVDLFVLPIVNPDGYEYSHVTDRLWRKNRRKVDGGKCDGVDLNRNFGYQWGRPGASSDPCEEDYHGGEAFSEPESRAVRDFLLRLKKQRGAPAAFLTLHSYSQVIMYPWDYTGVKAPNAADMERVGGKMAAAIKAASGLEYTVGQTPLLLYPTSGDSEDWAKGVLGARLTFGMEMRDTEGPKDGGSGKASKGKRGFLIPASEIPSSGKELLAAVRVLVQEAVA